MAEKDESGMSKGIRVGLTTARIVYLLVTVILLVLAGWVFTADAQTLTNLYSFGSSPNDGSHASGLVEGSDGNFYGTTQTGGTNNMGTVFSISPNGSHTNLHTFSGSPADGSNPHAGLVQGSDGSFYGTTPEGGTHNTGTVFRISSSGTYTTLYSFPGFPNDGAFPFGRLVQGSDGDFYGTTYYGGKSNYGTVFRITPSGSLTNLHSFGNSPDGASPYAGLIEGKDGSFYGTTWDGGACTNCYGKFGTVFRITSSGNITILWSFRGGSNGANPQTDLVQGSDGNFYGTTPNGGVGNPGQGTVFRITPSGSLTNLHSFGFSDGMFPVSGLVQGSDGNFYGTTSLGGTTNNCGFNGCGTVFLISPSGNETNPYSFGNFAGDGLKPITSLVQGSDGSFYGTTTSGGINNSGTVFKLTVPLSPPPYPINQITGAQLSGNNIVFTIPSIAGETYQLQFSSSMAPTNWVNVPGVSVTNSIGALLTLTNFGGALQPQGFYRFAITP